MRLSLYITPLAERLCLILLIVLTVHLLYPVSYSVHIYLNKLEQEKLLHSGDESFSTITLKKEELTKYIQDEGKELNIRGEMYDIAHIEYEGGYVTVTVLPDEKETEYNNKLADNIKRKGDSKDAKPVITWNPVAYYPTTIILPHTFPESAPKYQVCNAHYLSKGYILGIIKPPQLA